MNPFRFLSLFCLAGLLFLGAQRADAHPMGNFSINHYARFSAGGNGLDLRYILDFAEIPTAERMATLDSNGDGTVSAGEKSAFLQGEAATYLGGLSLKLDGRLVALVARSSDLETRPGAGGLPTLRVWMDCRVPLPSSGRVRVEYNDANFVGRTGWMEIIALGSGNRAIADSDASTHDQSRGLTIFPIDAGVVPPRQSSATFSLVSAHPGQTIGSVAKENPPAPRTDAPATNDQTPQNRFTQSIGERKLTPALVLGGLLFALAFGAVHALSPGHGKTMVAAYLVGSRGTPRHAVLLGLIVTITHTLGVFALGMALLFASRYVLPERLFPALSAISGLLIFAVGLWLFLSRWQGLQRGHGEHSHEHGDHAHSHDNEEHTHSHDEHEQGMHTHSHGGRAHSHAVPDGPLRLQTLVALGVSGGIVPCPEALVVLLAAVKLHRIGYGMVLITAFSIGLAAALIAIGMLVVSARQRLSRLDRLNENSPLVRFLPLGSAAIITLIGAVLTLRATMGGV